MLRQIVLATGFVFALAASAHAADPQKFSSEVG